MNLRIIRNVIKNQNIFNEKNIYFIINDENINEIDFFYTENNKTKCVKYKMIDNKILFYPIKQNTTDKKWLKLFTSNLLNNLDSKLGLCIKEFHLKKHLIKYNNKEHLMILNALLNIFYDLIEEKRVGYKNLKN